MLTVTLLRSLTPDAVQQRARAFSRQYALDWECWQGVVAHHGLTSNVGIQEFGRILRSWQATRPYPMRRPRADGAYRHQPPYLDDLVMQAQPHLDALGDTTVRDADRLWTRQVVALAGLWDLFAGLTQRGTASCVGITKAVMLQTCGRIGPPLDSRVRERLGLSRPETAEAWVEMLQAIAGDIRAFEESHGLTLEDIVDGGFRVGVGRIYDMVAWPST